MPAMFTLHYGESKELFGPCLCDLNIISCDVFNDMMIGMENDYGITQVTDGFVLSAQSHSKNIIDIHKILSCKQCKNRQKD